MPAVRTLPLRHKLLLLATLGLLPLLLFSAWAIWSAIDSQRREVERSTLELSRALATTVESEIDSTISALDVMGRSRLLLSGDIRGFYDLARTELAVRTSWSGIILTDDQGQVLFKTSLPFGAADGRIVDPVSLQRVLETGRPAVGLVALGQPSGRLAFPVRFPVQVDGRLRYVLTAAVKPDRILEALAKQRLSDGWVVSVLDSAGVRVARTRNHAIPRPSPSLKRLLDEGKASGTGVSRTLEGVEVYTGYTRLTGFDWTVAVGAPTAQVRQALMRSVAWYAGGALGSCLLFLGLAARIARRISLDIALLRDKAVQLGEGQPIEAARSGVEEVDQMVLALRAASQRLAATTESLKQALAEANAASATKDQFLAVLGHELRNPLAPMVTCLHLMELKADERTARERQIMARQVAHMHRLVDDLLDVSRIARGKIELRRQPVNLHTVVERSVEAVQSAAAAAQAPALQVRWPAATLWVDGDEQRLIQAVTNLLSNALRFGESRPVTVALAPAAVPGQAEITVVDEGVGLSAENLARAFDAFYQAPQAMERATGGLGLGLAIVKSIVELHGGTVGAASGGLGRGSTFRIALPTVAAPVDAQPAAAPAAPGPTGRVLLVDDNADALATLQEVLAWAGHQVRVAAEPHAALALIGEFAPEVAVFDIGLPGIDGYELARRARQTGWEGALIALTGYGQASDKARAEAAGFALHLTKPADPAALRAAVERLLARLPLEPASP